VGKDSIAGQRVRKLSARALTDCRVLRIEKKAIMLALAEDAAFRYQQDLVDQRCNSSEKRLASKLLRLSRFDADGRHETTIPKVRQDTLARMVGRRGRGSRSL
jgi:CRP-like cAMP-binding protein